MSQTPQPQEQQHQEQQQQIYDHRQQQRHGQRTQGSSTSSQQEPSAVNDTHGYQRNLWASLRDLISENFDNSDLESIQDLIPNEIGMGVAPIVDTENNQDSEDVEVIEIEDSMDEYENNEDLENVEVIEIEDSMDEYENNEDLENVEVIEIEDSTDEYENNEDLEDVEVIEIEDSTDEYSETEDYLDEDVDEYEVLTELTDAIGDARSNGICRRCIARLPSYTFPNKALQSKAYQTSCVVCMCDFEAKQMLRVLPCSHEFHAECVDEWLQTNCSCPVCRHDATDNISHTE